MNAFGALVVLMAVVGKHYSMLGSYTPVTVLLGVDLAVCLNH